MQKMLYIPVPLEGALSVLRHKLRLDQATGNPDGKVLAYTDRALAVLSVRTDKKDTSEVYLLAIEVNEDTFGMMMMGDMQHFGACASWLGDNILELENHAQELATHFGRLNLQIVSFQDRH